MASAITLTIIFLVISVILGFLAARKVFRIANTVFTIVAFGLTLASLALYLDAQNVQERMMGDKLFVLDDDGLKAAFIYRDQPTPVLLSDISAERDAYSSDDLDNVLRGRGILFIATPETFASVTQVTIEKTTFETSFVLEALKQADPRQAYAAKVRETANVPIGQEVKLPDVSAEEFKGLLFASLINAYLGQTTITDAIRAGALRAHPSGFTFWAIKNLPKGLLKFVISDEVD
ncbi:hypothetical protein HY493_00065 [Candidatus Woesearchaeota archaeon]|nr:hypothetical protein [Candidatus Woesearchaeota archaeon]